MIKYQNKKEAPSRKLRKSLRNSTFIKNRKEGKLRREARQAVRLEQLERREFQNAA